MKNDNENTLPSGSSKSSSLDRYRHSSELAAGAIRKRGAVRIRGAVRTRGTQPSGEGVSAGLKLLKDPHTEIRRNAVLILTGLSDPSAAAALVTAAEHDPEYAVQAEAAEALGQIADVRAEETLLRILSGHRIHHVRLRAARALVEIIKTNGPQHATTVAALSQVAQKDVSLTVRNELAHSLDKDA